MRYIYSLFFLWAIAHNLNPLLIPVLKEVCILTDFQSALVDSAFYIGYFAFALPAGSYINKFGYNKALTVGLMLFGVGALAVGGFGSQQQFYGALTGLFVMAAGLTFLETAANPLVTLLGDPKSATKRLNLAQSFNGLGATLSVFVGGMILFPQSTETAKTPIPEGETLAETLSLHAEKLLTPYFLIALVTVALGRAFWNGWIALPEIPNHFVNQNPENSKTHTPISHTTETYHNPNLNTWQTIKALITTTPYNLGLLAQFCYVGAQVGVGSFFIRYATTYGEVTKSVAATGLSLGLLLFMIGRFLGTFLLRWISPNRLLGFAAVAALTLSVMVALMGNAAGFWLLILLHFFMSIMFPTLFSLSLSQLKKAPPMASSLLIMSIVGGAFFPLAMGAVSDAWALQYAYLVPALCFIKVAYFAHRIPS